jgi:GT2 family glycosyltransferase
MLGIVIVNYKTDDRLIKYVVEELVKIVSPHLIVIVNNGCTPESNSVIAQECEGEVISGDNINVKSKVFVLGVEENLGYARGNNAGAEFLLKHFQMDYLLFSNCDLRFHDSVVDSLIRKMDKLPDVGLMGPYIETITGKKQNPSKFKSVWKLHIIPKLLYPFLPPSVRVAMQSPLAGEAVEGYCDYLSGSIFLVSVSVFLKTGMFDPNTFLYCEEPILAMRVRSAGFKVYYYDKVKVIHEHGYTNKKLKLNNKIKKYSYHSNRYFQKNYRNINRVELFLFDISYFVYMYLWAPVIATLSYFLKKK